MQESYQFMIVYVLLHLCSHHPPAALTLGRLLRLPPSPYFECLLKRGRSWLDVKLLTLQKRVWQRCMELISEDYWLKCSHLCHSTHLCHMTNYTDTRNI